MSKAKPDEGRKIIATNREVRHRYSILECYEAGIVLCGTEVKSLRGNKLAFNDAYVELRGGEAFLSHFHINEYSHGNRANHEPTRSRKLLLHKKEILDLKAAIEEKGKTVVPLTVYLKKGKIKIEIAVAKGKNVGDKRQSDKEKDAKREIDKVMKHTKRDRD
jgi:SsrA-binding protein